MSYNRVLRKRAVVTGGGNGIGRAICRLFAREGADVAVMDINKDEAERTLEFIQYENPKKQHCVITGDVSKVSDIKKTLETAWTSFGGKPNVLVNNAGVVGSARHMDMVSEDSMNKVIDIDLKAVYLMAKYFIAMLKDTDDTIPGTIVNISSMSGKHGMAMNADYAAAKAGVIGLTKSIALEFRWHNVRCNALLPGFTDTLMLQNTQKRILEELIHQVVPMRRLAQPEEIAKACLFLASEESSYIHGTCLEVAGGM